MERDCHSKTSVQKSGDHLTNHLYKANPLEFFYISLGIDNQDDCMPGALIKQHSITDFCLHYGNYLLSVGGVGCFILHCLIQTLTEVFCPHYRWSDKSVQAKPVYRPGDIIVFIKVQSP